MLGIVVLLLVHQRNHVKDVAAVSGLRLQLAVQDLEGADDAHFAVGPVLGHGDIGGGDALGVVAVAVVAEQVAALTNDLTVRFQLRQLFFRQI